MKLDTKEFETKMQKAIAAYQENLSVIRAGQANTAVLGKVMFEYWGTPTLLTSMADVRVVDSKTVTITPYDATTLKAMEKAILASDVGITPTNDGKIIRLVFPQLTEERRKELVKQVQKMGEDAKVAVRNIRRDGNDALKKLAKTEISEDEIKSMEDELQKLTDKYVKNIGDLVEEKSKEVLTV